MFKCLFNAVLKFLFSIFIIVRLCGRLREFDSSTMSIVQKHESVFVRKYSRVFERKFVNENLFLYGTK